MKSYFYKKTSVLFFFATACHVLIKFIVEQPAVGFLVAVEVEVQTDVEAVSRIAVVVVDQVFVDLEVAAVVAVVVVVAHDRWCRRQSVNVDENANACVNDVVVNDL